MRVDLLPNREGCDEKEKQPRKRSLAVAAFLDEHEHLQPLIYASMEAERVRKHRHVETKIRKLRKRGTAHPVLHDLTCTSEDPTFPVCHRKHFHRAVLDADPCNEFLDPPELTKAVIKCIGKSLLFWTDKGKKCRKKIKEEWHEFDGIKDYAKQFIKAHLSELDISFEVIDEIDVRFQLELAGTLSVGF